MATRTVRKLKRNKLKESSVVKDADTPVIVVTPPEVKINYNDEMKVKTSRPQNDVKMETTSKSSINAEEINNNRNDSDIMPSSSQTDLSGNDHNNIMANINVSKLIAELSENSKASKEEIENIQRKLLQQANEILKVNAFANSQQHSEQKSLESHQKYSTNTPTYGRIPVIVPRNCNNNVIGIPQLLKSDMIQEPKMMDDLSNSPRLIMQNKYNQSKPVYSVDQLNVTANYHDTQLVPEKLQRSEEIPSLFPANSAGMINGSQGNMQRVAMSAADAGRGIFYSGTGFAARAPASSRAALLGGECLVYLYYISFCLQERVEKLI